MKYFKIKTNKLLHQNDKGLDLYMSLLHRKVLLSGALETLNSGNYSRDDIPQAVANLVDITEDFAIKIHSIYGKAGVFKLNFLAHKSSVKDFTHFFNHYKEIIKYQKYYRLDNKVDLKCDNEKLLSSKEINNFDLNLILPSLSRKLYNPGIQHGHMVYGLGKPRILISHPFQSIKGENYFMTINTLNVTKSLNTRGYDGSFLFLDYLPGLNFEVNGLNAWVLWFSIIAAHSDLVLFIKDYEKDFSDSQKKEIKFTPDRIQKKILEMSSDELTCDEEPKYGHVDYYFDTRTNTRVTKEQWYKIEAEKAMPFVELYTKNDFPNDRIFVMNEAEELKEYPLDYPMYENDY